MSDRGRLIVLANRGATSSDAVGAGGGAGGCSTVFVVASRIPVAEISRLGSPKLFVSGLVL